MPDYRNLAEVCRNDTESAVVLLRVPQVCASMKERAILSSSCRVLWSVKLRSIEPMWLFSCRYVIGVLFMFTGFLQIDKEAGQFDTIWENKTDTQDTVLEQFWSRPWYIYLDLLLVYKTTLILWKNADLITVYNDLKCEKKKLTCASIVTLQRNMHYIYNLLFFPLLVSNTVGSC